MSRPVGDSPTSGGPTGSPARAPGPGVALRVLLADPLDTVFGDSNPEYVEDKDARELVLETTSYMFAIGNLRTSFERSGTFTQFRSNLEQDAVDNDLLRHCLQVLDWIEVARSQQKTLFQIGLTPDEFLWVRPCSSLLLVRFLASVTTAESDQVAAFINSLDPAAPGGYGLMSSKVLELMNSSVGVAQASMDVLRDNPDLRM